MKDTEENLNQDKGFFSTYKLNVEKLRNEEVLQEFREEMNKIMDYENARDISLEEGWG